MMAGLTVRVDLKETELFKALAAATALLFEKADYETKVAALEILKDHGGAILVTREFGGES